MKITTKIGSGFRVIRNAFKPHEPDHPDSQPISDERVARPHISGPIPGEGNITRCWPPEGASNPYGYPDMPSDHLVGCGVCGEKEAWRVAVDGLGDAPVIFYNCVNHPPPGHTYVSEVLDLRQKVLAMDDYKRECDAELSVGKEELRQTRIKARSDVYIQVKERTVSVCKERDDALQRLADSDTDDIESLKRQIDRLEFEDERNTKRQQALGDQVTKLVAKSESLARQQQDDEKRLKSREGEVRVLSLDNKKMTEKISYQDVRETEVGLALAELRRNKDSLTRRLANAKAARDEAMFRLNDAESELAQVRSDLADARAKPAKPGQAVAIRNILKTPTFESRRHGGRKDERERMNPEIKGG